MALRVLTPILHEDGRTRCPWPGTEPLYVDYHDTEWGVPEWDDRALFEKLILDGFQAGLSWITILRKRETFRAAFADFNPEKIVMFNEADVERLMQDTGIIRNRAKITGTIKSAGIYLDMMSKGSFSDYLWKYMDGVPKQNRFTSMADVPAETDISRAMSKDLKKLGFNFCGPVIIYAFMQAVGMVNDHLVGCYRHEECRLLGLKHGG